MSASNASRMASLQAFLIWNALGHFAPTKTFRTMRAYWAAKREKYEAMIGSLNFTGLPGFRRLTNASIIGDIFGGVIIIVLGSSLFTTVANFTTGITIAHTGFTPNPNVTSSVGFVPIVQLIPFLFAAMILMLVYALFERHLPGGL